MRAEIERWYWTFEVDCVYRWLHESFKVFHTRSLIVKYLGATLALVGEGIPERKGEAGVYDERALMRMLKRLGLDPDFTELIGDALAVEFHAGAIPLEEWRRMSSALYSAKVAFDACARFAEDLLGGRAPTEALDYYQALAIYVLCPEYRYGHYDAFLLAATRHGNEDMKRAYAPQVAQMKEAIRAAAAKVGAGRPVTYEEAGLLQRHVPRMRRLGRRDVAVVEFTSREKEGVRYVNRVHIYVPRVTGELKKRLRAAGFRFNRDVGLEGTWIKGVLADPTIEAAMATEAEAACRLLGKGRGMVATLA